MGNWELFVRILVGLVVGFVLCEAWHMMKGDR